ncbi:MAG: hydroxymethylbilane synthase [Pseudomonadota bacterium]
MSVKALIRIGTRQSRLALWQANYVRTELQNRYPDLDIELVKIVSEGDKTLDVPLSQVGGKGLFLKELETALVDGDIDIAVHSMKDVTVELPEGLHIGVICPRENPFDALVSNRFGSLGELPEGATVGTCSLRRRSQLLAAYSHLTIQNLRGNVNTRLSKLDSGEFDAIVLAASGLMRLELKDRIRQVISDDICLPAVGQGAIGIECRIADNRINSLIRPLGDLSTATRVMAERQLNARLGGGCHVPVAAFAELSRNTLHLRGFVASVDGKTVLKAAGEADPSDWKSLGDRVAQDLLRQGADRILEDVYSNENRPQ